MEREIVAGLMQRGIPYAAAVGFAGNFSVESGFNPGINEINPTVAGSRGGYGLAQWTGPRRRQYEAFAKSQGAAPDDLNAQLDFLTWELQNTEKGAAQAIFAARDPAEAARLVSEKFLRPGIPHLDNRIREATRIAGGNYQDAPQGQQNALAPQQEPAKPQLSLVDMRTSGGPLIQSTRNALAQPFNMTPQNYFGAV